MDTDYSEYIALKDSGKSDIDIGIKALSNGKDFWFLIRMLRAVYEIDIGQARELYFKISKVYENDE